MMAVQTASRYYSRVTTAYRRNTREERFICRSLIRETVAETEWALSATRRKPYFYRPTAEVMIFSIL